jgi:hypothetical protein
MVISHEYRYIFYSIPKNGTNSIYDLLQNRFSGKRVGDFHYYNIPEYAKQKNYFLFTCIRNPYDRAISAFFGIQQGKTLKYNAPIFADCPNSKDMETLFNWAIEKGEKVPTGWLRSQYHYIKLNKKPDKYLRLQYLKNDFLNLPFVNGNDFKIRKLNKSNHLAHTYYLNEKTIPLINEMYKDDFDYLGFTKLEVK